VTFIVFYAKPYAISNLELKLFAIRENIGQEDILSFVMRCSDVQTAHLLFEAPFSVLLEFQMKLFVSLIMGDNPYFFTANFDFSDKSTSSILDGDDCAWRWNKR
jgi:hypothetical protein